MALLVSCQEDEDKTCDEILIREDISLSEKSIDFITMYSNKSKVIFKDSNENEIEFIIEDYKDTFLLKTDFVSCPEDTSKSSRSEREVQWIQAVLSNKNLDQRIIIRITNLFNSLEEMIIVYGQIDGTFIDYIESDGLLAYNINPEDNRFINKLDSLQLRNQTFYNLIQPNPDDPGFEKPFNPQLDIIYSNEFGIIFINDKLKFYS